MALRKVELWNDHTQAHIEMFRGEELVIPAKSCVIMDDGDATLFMGQFTGIKRDGHGKDISVKMLRKRYITEETKAEAEVKTCMACKKEFKTQEELDSHTIQHEALKVKDEPNPKKKFFA